MKTSQNSHKVQVDLVGLFPFICNKKEGLFSIMKYNCNNTINLLKLLIVILILRVENQLILK